MLKQIINTVKKWLGFSQPEVYQSCLHLQGELYSRLDIWTPLPQKTDRFHAVKASIVYNGQHYYLKYHLNGEPNYRTADKLISLEKIDTGYIIGTMGGVRYTLTR